MNVNESTKEREGGRERRVPKTYRTQIMEETVSVGHRKIHSFNRQSIYGKQINFAPRNTKLAFNE